MKKSMITLLTIATFVLLPQVTHAATTEVTWTDHEKYRDIKPSSEGRKHFRERVFKNFEKHFAKLAEKLPEGQILKLNITDVDLAGDTHVGGVDQIRIVKDIYFPKMNFSYSLFDANGIVVLSEEVILKDMNFMMGNTLKYKNKSLGYEKKMIDEWFTETFKSYLIEKK